MKYEKKHFSELKDYLEFFGLPSPENSMLSIVSFDNLQKNQSCPSYNIFVSSDFYTISLKKIISGEVYYGRTKYDCSSGTMIFTAPNQEMKIDNLKVESYGKTIFFHKDFIRKSKLQEEIKTYNFFNYSINESLHLSEREKKIIESLLNQIEEEYNNNQDEFSEEIIIEHLTTLLKYSNRFYYRQFLHRKKEYNFLETKFIKELDNYFLINENNKLMKTPRTKDIAEKLNMTPRYLTDKLKAETGKTANEQIQLYLIEKAKNLLLEDNQKVATVAFKLGFEYQQHFSKFFKEKVGLSPKEYYENLKK